MLARSRSKWLSANLANDRSSPAAPSSRAALGVASMCGPLFWALLFSPASQAQPPAAADAAEEFVAVQRGELPIVISAPHGGAKEVPGVPKRDGEGLQKGPSGFVTSRDTGTEELARALAAEIERRYQKKPYYVISLAHRRYLDPNRPAAISYEDPDAKPVYDRYHDSLAQYCREVLQQHHAGLLVDLHGQGSRKDTVFRGTQNGKTVELLRQRHGEAAQAGEESLFGLLRSRGWTVFPNPLDGKEQAGYTGGYIVQSYGSHKAGGIDAVQLEFGSSYRAATRRQQTAAELTDAIAAYGSRYLSLAAPAKPAMPRLKVAVFVGGGASAGKANVLALLSKDPQLQLQEIDEQGIAEGKLAGNQVLIHPGGSGSKQGGALGEEGRSKVKQFVANGGGYVGICAGAYLATCDYDWSLHILDAKVIDRAHWARGAGDVEIGLTPAGQSMLKASAPRATIYYHQGPLLAPANDPQVADYEPLANFEGDIAKNGAPRGVMPGATAIAAGPHGKGRVICFSPHPEKTPAVEQWLLRAVHWSGEAGSAAKN